MVGCIYKKRFKDIIITKPHERIRSGAGRLCLTGILSGIIGLGLIKKIKFGINTPRHKYHFIG